MQVAFAKVAMSEFAQNESEAPFCPGKVQHWLSPDSVQSLFCLQRRTTC